MLLPYQRSVDVLKHYGIRKVIVIKSRPFGVDFAARPVDGLPVDRVESGDIVEFKITG